MADQLNVLRAPITPVDPDPAFAAALRTRIERALSLPEGVTVSNPSALRPPSAATPPSPTAAAVPYLAVRGARQAIDWYIDVLDARLSGDPIVMPDGRIGHSELRIGDGVIYLSEEHPELGVVAPTPGASSVSLVLDVADADATLAHVLEGGGRADREPYEGYGHRNAWVVDPFGHRWLLQSPVPATGPEAPGEPLRQGDIAYVSVWTPDAQRAARFYADVLGWRYAPEADPGRPQVLGTAVSTGIYAGPGPATLFCCYAVDDAEQGFRAVREAGGEAADPVDRPYGRIVDCVDDQGVAFALVEPADGGRPPANGAAPGDLAYVTLQVVSSARTRAFYSAVLGWRFSPGQVEDGWGVDDIVPMTGLSGGHDESIAVPMWRVDDIEAAVERVRGAGGTSTEPERQPYGISASCTDDQGGQFYLGQL